MAPRLGASFWCGSLPLEAFQVVNFFEVIVFEIIVCEFLKETANNFKEVNLEFKLNSWSIFNKDS